MLKKTTYRTPNRVDIHTGCTTFDRQAEALMTGNVWGCVQFSNYIRPESELECNGRVNAPGHLRDYDLSQFTNLPARIRRAVLDETATEQAILYEIRHWTGNSDYGTRQKHVHGYILTKGHNGGHRLIRSFVTGRTHKSEKVISAVLPYLADIDPSPVVVADAQLVQ